MQRFVYSIFYIFYYVLSLSFFISLKICSLFSSNIKKTYKTRTLDKNFLKLLKEKREKKEKSILFFCSSAGEYEQAKPLIDYYNGLDYYILIIFFSPSGIRFAKAREESLDYILSPLDLTYYWNQLFKILKPSLVFIVRHELWPSFLNVAKKYAPIILIDASMNRKYNFVSLFLKKSLLSYMNAIFIVDKKDLSFYKTISNHTDIIESKDTKYDRVRLRSQEKKEDIENLRIKLQALSKDENIKEPNLNKGYKYFIVGSAWPKDTDIVLDTYSKNYQKLKDWKIILAVHEIKEPMIKLMQNMCKDRNLSYVLYSKLILKNDDEIQDILSQTSVIIVDILGKLSELYGISHLCWVGGALHYKIHNVLEPSMFGLNIAHGDLYKDQKEAKLLVDNNLSTVCTSCEELESWWLSHKDSFINQKLIDKMKELSFGSQIILNYVKTHYSI